MQLDVIAIGGLTVSVIGLLLAVLKWQSEGEKRRTEQIRKDTLLHHDVDDLKQGQTEIKEKLGGHEDKLSEIQLLLRDLISRGR